MLVYIWSRQTVAEPEISCAKVLTRCHASEASSVTATVLNYDKFCFIRYNPPSATDLISFDVELPGDSARVGHGQGVMTQKHESHRTRSVHGATSSRDLL